EPGTEAMKQINRKINSILSPDIAQNFVFDGERIEKIADPSKKKNRDEISNAISSMSALPTVKNSLDTLTQLQKNLRKIEAENISEEVALLEQRISENESERQKMITNLDNKEVEYNKIGNDINQVDQNLLNY